MQKCWQTDPQDRPSFEEVYAMITDVAKNFGIYAPSQPKVAEEPPQAKQYGKPIAHTMYHQPSDEESLGNYNTMGE